MFSLIITIISIALVAALALATIYYGGTAFTLGSSKAAAATIISQAQQIAGASALEVNDHPDVTLSIAALSAYLSATPTVPLSAGGAAWTVASGGTGILVTLTGVPAVVCNLPTATNGAQYYCNATGLPAGATVAVGATGTFSYND